MSTVRLETRALTVTAGGRTLVQGLELAFRAGENWAILGPNGSGKTSLLHTLAGLRAPAAGQVLLDGEPIAHYSPRARARRLGILFQETASAFPATVLETVLTGRHPHLGPWEREDAEDLARAERALSLLELAGLGARAVSTLSGGERRRVEIAALLVQDAPINLLDEPTQHLDLRHQVQVLAHLCARAREPAAAAGGLNVFVLHDVNLALRFASHALLVFGDGSYSHGPIAQILTREALERLYRCPFAEYRAARHPLFFPA